MKLGRATPSPWLPVLNEVFSAAPRVSQSAVCCLLGLGASLPACGAARGAFPGAISELCGPCPSLEEVPVRPAAAAFAKGLRSVARALRRGCLSAKAGAQSFVPCSL